MVITETVWGIPWYSTILEDLFRVIPRHAIGTRIIVCYNVPIPGQDKPRRIFACFESPETLFRFLATVPADYQHFFEVTPGERPQKPHFDLDFSTKAAITVGDLPADHTLEQFHALTTEVFDATISALLALGVASRDIRVYSSNNFAVAPHKCSYHIVIPRYTCPNAAAAKAIWGHIDSTFPTSWRKAKYLDPMVYSTLQQFRLLYSQKAGSGRPKRLEKQWPYHGLLMTGLHPYDEYGQFVESLAGWVDGAGDEFPELPERQPSPDDVAYVSKDAAPEDIIEKAIDLMNQCEQLAPPHARFVQTMGQMILLKRFTMNHCSVCNDDHIHNNPFLVVKEISAGTWRVTYYCRQAERECTQLGYIRDAETIPDLAASIVPAEIDPLEACQPMRADGYRQKYREMQMRRMLNVE